ncbi:MAG: recombination mediator RecR [Candidatus Saganbacteria bacterium]|nr:recombination mediator RecR [Candidatus Saganbacteria bacterium]
MPNAYADSFQKLIDELKKMPGVGPKSAQRLAFYILSLPNAEVQSLIKSLIEVKEKMKYCGSCYNLTDVDPCKICSDSSRDPHALCVVADPKDLIAVERSGSFKGLYHVLGGLISPLDGMGPESLRIKELLGRLRNGVKEVILATNPTTEGEATSMYLSNLIKPLGVKITRIAYGLPVGADMDYADEVTLTKSFEGRREV